MLDWPEPTMLQIWDYARGHDLTIVSKNADCHHLSFVHGPPPQGHLDPARQLLHDGHRDVATIESGRNSRLWDRDGVGVSGTFLGRLWSGHGAFSFNDAAQPPQIYPSSYLAKLPDYAMKRRPIRLAGRHDDRTQQETGRCGGHIFHRNPSGACIGWRDRRTLLPSSTRNLLDSVG